MTINSTLELVNSFLNGDEAGAYQQLNFTGANFYAGSAVAAKRASDGNVLIAPSMTLGDELNDAFVVAVVTKGRGFTRVANFQQLLNANARVDDFRHGRYEQLRTIGNVYGFEFNEADAKVYEDRRQLLERHAKELVTVELSVKEVEDRIRSFFNAKSAEEKKALAEAERAAMGEKQRDATARWDAGENLPYDLHCLVKGAGNEGTRIRARVVRDGARTNVEGTTGETTTLNQIRAAFNLVAPYVFGTSKLTDDAYTSIERGYNHRLGDVRGYRIELAKNDMIVMGCQRVSKNELARFANIQGWPLDGSLVTD